MTTTSEVELKAQKVRYFSQLDEKLFFDWLKMLPCVSNVEGKGDTLLIRVLESKVDEYALRELLALFRRYGISMKQLKAFDRRPLGDWFRNKDAYWYKAVFATPKSKI